MRYMTSTMKRSCLNAIALLIIEVGFFKSFDFNNITNDFASVKPKKNDFK